MAIGDLNLVENLIYGIFGNPLVFSLAIMAIFLFFSMKYDIPKWVSILFFVPFGLWIGFLYLPGWAVITILLGVGVMVGPKLIQATRS